jgi:hypothetical protein
MLRRYRYEQTGLELTIQLDEILQPHSLFEVEIEYAAALNLRMTGLYQSTYITPTGSEVVVIGTHMEPENARRVSPASKKNLRAILTGRFSPALTLLLSKQNLEFLQSRVKMISVYRICHKSAKQA